MPGVLQCNLTTPCAAKVMIADLGGVVASTAPSLQTAAMKIEEPGLDCVMLDINLKGDLSFGLASELRKRGIPFFF